MGKPQRTTTKKVKDQKLVESCIEVESVIKEEEPRSAKDKTVDKGFYIKDESLSPTLSQADVQSIQLEYEKKIELLKKEVEAAKNRRVSLTKNEEKLLNAIRSEILSQSTDQPVMTRTYIGKNYGINEKYLGLSIKGLMDKGLIERKAAKTANNQSSFSWELLA